MSAKNRTRPKLFCFGLGYSAGRFAEALLGDGWSVSGTCREEESLEEHVSSDIEMFRFDRSSPMSNLEECFSGVTHFLSSVPPDSEGDAVLDCHEEILRKYAGQFQWAGYLSTTGVYGTRDGDWVDEGSELFPTSDRAKRRVAAEKRWLALTDAGFPIHSFRLAGIYGPGRNILEDIMRGRARRLDKPGHVFSRIHVDDIAHVLKASMSKPNPGSVYNVCDDGAASPADVVSFGCELLGVEPPPLVPFETAYKEMSPMAATFWADNKRVDNRRIKEELGVELIYPDYRKGLSALVETIG